MKMYNERIMFLTLLFFMICLASCNPSSDTSNAGVSVLVKYMPPFGSDIVYGKKAPAMPTDGVILKIANNGVIYWVNGSDTVDINSKQLSMYEFDKIKEYLRKITNQHCNLPQSPGFIIDLSCISIELTYGKESVSWVFNMNIDEFFSGKQLPGSRPKENWQYEEVQDFKRYLVNLCKVM
jgi:hypothetical protein